jgi:alcohol dehydrogenase/benzil reductase ((S)-benzoin forming)
MKTAVVTGASSGIGKSITLILLQDGYKVYGLSRSKPAITNKQFIWLKCDLNELTSIEGCLEAIIEPTIEVLISNAGVILVATAARASLERISQTFNVNTFGPILLTKYLSHKLEHAVIISISSDSDRIPEAELSLYDSSKAANTMFFKALALEMTEARIYTVLPDYVDTPMLRASMNDPEFDWSTIIQPSDIANLCQELVNDKHQLASGSNIIVVTEALKESLENNEQLYGYVTDSQKLLRLNP